jgi:hypothetical protein
MIYSCFNEKAGHYEYFEDDRALAVNGDFPVPQLHKLQAGRVGVPARDAGRALPRGTKRVGAGWQARGTIVQCKNTPMRGLGTNALGYTPLLGYIALGYFGLFGALAGAAAAHLGDKKLWQGAALGAVSGIAGGVAISAVTEGVETRRTAGAPLR